MSLENAIPSPSGQAARSTDCGVCGGATRDEVARPASTYASPGAYRIATCVRCGSGQTMPRPDMAELDAFYSKEYKYDAHLLIEGEKRWRSRQILDHAMPPNAKRVLDIGCMYGYLLDEARARGVEAIGVELSAGPARAARERGLDVFCGTVEAFAESKPARFDLIVAQHVLEHVTDPASFLKTAHALLAPGGALCICVPNFDARARRVFREAWGWYQVPVHLHHFGERGLRDLIEQCGFEGVRATKRGGDSLFVLLTLLQGLGRMPKSDEAAAPGAIGKAMVRTASTVLRPYYFMGDDELMIVARAKTVA